MQALKLAQQRVFFILLVCNLLSCRLSFAASEPEDANDEYIFDPALFRNQSSEQIALVEKFTQSTAILAGAYKVNLYVNGQFIQRVELAFEQKNQTVEACIPAELWDQLGLAAKNRPEQHFQTAKHCAYLSDTIQSSHSHFDFNKMRLDLSIPQSEMLNLPRGYVNPNDWDAGESIGFINYVANYYYTANNNLGNRSNLSAGFMALKGGFNLGKWQYRQQSTLRYNPDNTLRWNNQRLYISRPVASLQAVANVGQLYSSGQFFSGLSFNGVNLSFDDRMLADSMRGYAPTIQGIAQSNAKVSVYQNNSLIYESSVAAGPFKISDLYPTNANGNLTVKVQEVDGTTTQFNVPFSAVPESLRAGAYRYHFNLGKTRNIGEDTYFSDLSFQRGLSNALTLNSGLRIAESYQALLLGSSYVSDIGAFGSNFTLSNAKLATEGNLKGWMASLNYSKTIQPTQTTIALAGYRYSSQGYRDLGDVIGARAAAKNGQHWRSDTYQQRARLELTLNQSLAQYGTLFASGSMQYYRNNQQGRGGRDHDLQAQLGYNKLFANGINLNMALIRQYYTLDDTQDDVFTDQKHAQNNAQNNAQNHSTDQPLSRKRQKPNVDTLLNLSISFALGRSKKLPPQNVDFSYSRGNQAESYYQTNWSGSVGTAQSLSYSFGVGYDQDKQQTILNTSLNKRLDSVALAANASKGNNFWQVSANAQGALALHAGGVTWGPYLSETFALIEAKGAHGAKLFNAQGIRINRQGYALLPAISPYRYNSISLDPTGISDHVEIETQELRIAPYAGSSSKLVFKTRTGYPLLLQAKLENGQFPPLGADVMDINGQIIGMVGQNGQMYIRTEKHAGQLKLQWGEQADQYCQIDYQLSKQDLQQSIIHLAKNCNAGASE